MADTKISALSDGTPLVATDALVIARSGNNFKVTPDVSGVVGGRKTYLNKPGGNLTRTSTSVGAFSTAWQITGVVVASGQNVMLTLSCVTIVSTGNADQILALFRGSTQIASAFFSSAPSSTTQTRHFSWIDENPGAATYTYEVRGASFGGSTLTVYQSNITTDVSGGGAIFIAEVYTP